MAAMTRATKCHDHVCGAKSINAMLCSTSPIKVAREVLRMTDV